MEKKLEMYANAFTHPGPGSGLVKIDQPFYENGLFLACRKEIFAFRKSLSKNIFDFYTYLLKADQARKIDKSDQFFKPANEAMKNEIISAYNLLPNLKKELRKYFHG